MTTSLVRMGRLVRCAAVGVAAAAVVLGTGAAGASGGSAAGPAASSKKAAEPAPSDFIWTSVPSDAPNGGDDAEPTRV